MRLTGEMKGLEDALRKTAALARVGEVKWRTAVEFVLRELRDYARLHAPFTDRTGNLRNSIDFEMDPNGEPAGTLLAGMQYGIFVEVRDGLWVLQGAIDFYRPKLAELFRGKIRFEPADLEAAAESAKIYYRELRQRERSSN